MICIHCERATDGTWCSWCCLESGREADEWEAYCLAPLSAEIDDSWCDEVDFDA